MLPPLPICPSQRIDSIIKSYVCSDIRISSFQSVVVTSGIKTDFFTQYCRSATCILLNVVDHLVPLELSWTKKREIQGWKILKAEWRSSSWGEGKQWHKRLKTFSFIHLLWLLLKSTTVAPLCCLGDSENFSAESNLAKLWKDAPYWKRLVLKDFSRKRWLLACVTYYSCKWDTMKILGILNAFMS